MEAQTGWSFELKLQSCFRDPAISIPKSGAY